MCHHLSVIGVSNMLLVTLFFLEGYGATTFNFIRQVNRCSLASQDFPLMLGRDFSGTVVHVGKNVKNIKPGAEVL